MLTLKVGIDSIQSCQLPKVAVNLIYFATLVEYDSLNYSLYELYYILGKILRLIKSPYAS